MNSEIVIGLAGAIGTNFDKVISLIGLHFSKAGYDLETIRMSCLLNEDVEILERDVNYYNDKIQKINDTVNNEGKKLEKKTRKDACNQLDLNDIKYSYLAYKAIEKIKNTRRKKKRVLILNSIKRPDEVNLLKYVYGDNFFLVSIYSSYEDRKNMILHESYNDNDVECLNDLFAKEKDEVTEGNEDVPYGQKLLRTYPKADFFMHEKFLFEDTERFFKLLFGYPFITPTRDEFAMHVAYGIMCKSSDMHRQVGASIIDKRGNILAVGCNDTPKFGGGTYWDGDLEDHRDFAVLQNTQNKMPYVDQVREKIREDIIKKLKQLATGNNKKSIITFLDGNNVNAALQDSEIKSLLEFYRSVHAEVAAITAAAYNGIAIKGQKLYCTTFPCHLCCKAIISGGLKEVFYIEPYPKSRSKYFYEDMIVDKPDNKEIEKNKVIFNSYRGVSPTNYTRFFMAKNKYERIVSDKINKFDVNTKSIPALLKTRTPSHYAYSEKYVLKLW